MSLREPERSEGTRQSAWVNKEQKNIPASALVSVRLIGLWNPYQE
ncbi:MAG: hypothetical protein PHV06_07520 [bacterium]|nr:hypothetical protein [bacterium]